MNGLNASERRASPCWRLLPLLMVLFIASLIFLGSKQHSESGLSRSAAEEVNKLNDRWDRLWVNSAVSDDTFRTALVMPCTVIEAVTSLPFAMKSVLESQDLPHETIIVFGLRRDLESALIDLFPLNISDKIDNARDYLRNFILQWTHSTPQSHRIIRDSLEANSLGPDDKVSPLEFLDALNVSAYLKKKEYQDDGVLKQWDAMDFHDHYIHNIYKMYKDYESMDAMAKEIPNFKIILNRDDYPYANSNRQKGAYSAFQDVPFPRDNDIVSFVDCDDTISPQRSHMIEQAFKENPDVVMIGGGFRVMHLDHKWEEMIDDPEYVKTFSDVLSHWSKDEDTPEKREALYAKYFDFRDPAIKKKYMDKQADPSFLKDNDGVIQEDPWDITKWGGPNAYTWWLGSTGKNVLSDMPGFQLANGHSSWRQRWLINDIVDLPNPRIGEDTRLNYMSLKLGGRALGLTQPITTYVLPGGNDKREALANLLSWNIDLQDK
eukprot:GHVH01012545.1.p1 GENE.GHVH01012545.1~~GHVH01012545.1.p1  ORF type:complete len:491 (-),score=76.54 GHVH01012545.1:59-1531(-)